MSVPNEVPGLGVVRWGDDALDVPAAAEHELVLTAKHLRGGVGRLPGDDVVGEASKDEGIAVDLGQIDRCPKDGERAGILERVRHEHVQEVPVQSCGQGRRVVVPVQDVEGRRGVAHQVVVHPVVPDEVVGAQPGEAPSKLVTAEHALEP
jgi:hypothetical protein